MRSKTCISCGACKPSAAFSSRRVICNQCRGSKAQLNAENNWRTFFMQRISAARQRHDEVLITPEFLIEMLVEQGGNCALSGRKLTRQRGDLAKASIDRMSPAKGYTPDNVRLVSWAVNRMRNSMTDAEFRGWVMALANTPNPADTVS